MSDADRDAILGRTMREHKEAAKELAALHAEAEYIGNYLTALGHALRTHHNLDAGAFGSFSGPITFEKWPTPNGLEKLVRDIAEAERNKNRLAKLLGDADIQLA
jgi:hypothetical protein